MNIVAEKWDEIIHKLKIEYGLSNVSFRTWIEPLEVYNVSDSTVYILVPLKSSVDYINQKYLLPFRFPPIRLYAAVTVSAPFTGLWQLSRIRFLWNR